ncbi:MAG: glycosyltransferase family 2 protein [Chitinophagales bacterium]|nr:glycosyltransferase family 2 protein [Chitinophagales bacterium]
MLNQQKVTLIIPFFNEEKSLSEVISTIPIFVDFIILVDDGSTDKSVLVAKDNIDSRSEAKSKTYIGSLKEIECLCDEINLYNDGTQYIIIQHSTNLGKGAGVKSGYQIAKLLNTSCIATMDGDGQMCPKELEQICMPVINGQADYTKGNRLSHPNFNQIIPFVRLIGIYVLAFFTRVCSGYHFIEDAQSGFTAIHLSTLKKIDISAIYNKYGYVNDVLVRLSVLNSRVIEVPITPIYKKERVSKMNVLLVIPKISFLMAKMFFWKQRYLKSNRG